MDSASKRPSCYLDGPGDAKKARSGFADNVLLQAVGACLYDKATLHFGTTLIPLVTQLAEAGCQGLDGSGPTEVEDPRALRRALMHSLGNKTECVSTFSKGMHEAFQDQRVLSCALLPMNTSGEVSSLMQT